MGRKPLFDMTKCVIIMKDDSTFTGFQPVGPFDTDDESLGEVDNDGNIRVTEAGFLNHVKKGLISLIEENF